MRSLASCYKSRPNIIKFRPVVIKTRLLKNLLNLSIDIVDGPFPVVHGSQGSWTASIAFMVYCSAVAYPITDRISLLEDVDFVDDHM